MRESEWATKLSQWYKEIILPAGLLSSVIIGAGIFALPFVFNEAGFLVGLFYLALFTVVFVIVHKMYAEVIENTKGKHRFVGYAKIYFKKWGFLTTTVTTAIGFTLTLVVYIALAGDFIRLVAPTLGEIGPYVFWAVTSLAVILSLRRLANLEFGITLAMGLIVATLFFAGVFYGDRNIPPVNLSNLFAPYGVILFALSGRAAISAIHDYYDRNKISKAKLKKSISLGTIIPAIVYVLFVVAVLFLSGESVSEEALSRLTNIPYALLFLLGSLGIFALWTSYFFLAVEVRDIFRYDFKLNRTLALFAVVAIPIWLYAAGIRNFIGLVGVVGGVFLAIDSIMTISMYSKIKGWKFLARALVAIFAVGIAYVLINI